MNTQVQRYTPAHIDIKPRKMRFEAETNKDRYWLAGNKLFTAMFNFASMLFPEGELFFIKSVQHFQSEITDPKLREDIRGFIEQEITHSQHHDKFNQDIYGNGFRWLKVMEKQLHNILAWSHKYVPKKLQLSFTVTAEHFTAIGANLGLKHPDLVMHKVDPKYREIWLWHAVEESEHKAVAFDVLKAVSGSYWLRIAPLAVIMMLTLLSLLVSAVVLPPWLVINKIRGRRILPKKRKKPLPEKVKMEIKQATNTFIKDLFSFFKPSFHPWDCDNTDLIESWKSNYSQTGKSALKI